MAKSVTTIDATGGEDNTLAQHTNATNGAAPSRKRKIQQTSEARAAPLLVTADDTASKRARGAKKTDWPRSKGPCVVCGEVTKERCFKHTSCDAAKSPSTVWVLVKTEDKEGYTPDWEVQCDSKVVGVYTRRDLAEKAKKQVTRGMESNDDEVFNNGTCFNTSYEIHIQHIQTEVDSEDDSW